MARIENAFVRANNLRVDLATAHPNWLTEHDTRLSALSDVLNILRATRIALIVLDDHLVNPEWWRKHRGVVPSIKEASFDLHAFSQATKNHLIFFTFSAVEHSFRLLLRAIAPGVASDATAECQSVYTALLLRLPDVSKDVRTVLEVARLTRNAYHNGGIHHPRSRQSVVLDWGAYRCAFQVGQPIEFANWTFAADLAEALVEVLAAVFLAESVQLSVAPIVDYGALPYSDDA